VSHSKKRPDNLVLGRLFDGRVLDMMELHVENFVGLAEHSGPKCMLGARPVFLFEGAEFEQEPAFVRLKSLLLDFFRAEESDKTSLAGLQRVTVVTAAGGRALLRNYFLAFKKSCTPGRVPRVELMPMGPSMDFDFRRSHMPAPDVESQAMRQAPKNEMRVKNQAQTPVIGDRVGRLHMKAQPLEAMQTRKIKGLKRVRSDEKRAAQAAARAAEGVPADGASAAAAPLPAHRHGKEKRGRPADAADAAAATAAPLAKRQRAAGGRGVRDA
jgi:ribosome production factor 2